ncbi:MAG: YifB family Mg chelatase-like AAA ATPase [Coriobacteriales bacterium]|nr:YifB family Mg chelatase-like AAA ATPase [Coriobacteriales bacterium]
MGQCNVLTTTLVGVEGRIVEVQVDVGSGLPSFSIVGLPDAAVQEARERVRAAVRTAGFDFPNARVVVNLAPAPLRKHGTGFDLPIAIALLTATGQIPPEASERILAVGELSLSGDVRLVPGMLAHAVAARGQRLSLLAALGSPSPEDLPGLRCRTISHLAQLRTGAFGVPTGGSAAPRSDTTCDLSEVAGQEGAKRALLIAAAGGHNMLMVGPPGSGKTMLARRLPTILPPLDSEERLEAALVHSVAGLQEGDVLHGVRPFRAPHHSSSIAGLIGGGSPPRPGEASLAHTGVLFLDEMPEFAPSALQTLRQPLEDGFVTLVRADARLRFPARFALVGAANPCPCGFLGDSQRTCTCPEPLVERYRNRMGGPLLDRIDLGVRVDRVDPALLFTQTANTDSAAARESVIEARERARTRGGVSSRLSGAALIAACAMSPSDRGYLENASRARQLSGRGVTRLLRVARTIADLEGRARVRRDHLEEALLLRTHDTPTNTPGATLRHAKQSVS